MQSAIDGVLNLLERERLGDVVVGAGLHRLDRIFNGRVRGHQDYEGVGRAPLDLAQQFETAHLGHLVVGQNEIELRLGQQRDRLRAVLGGADLVAERLEERGEAAADIALVIDNEQLGHQISVAAGISTMNRAPCELALSTKILPPCASTISLTIERPSPAEPFSKPSEPYCTKRSKI